MTLTIDEKEAFLRLLDQHAGIIHKVAAGYRSALSEPRRELAERELPSQKLDWFNQSSFLWTSGNN